MRNLHTNICLIPVAIFLVVSLSGPTLVIHHDHPIEMAPVDSDGDKHDEAQAENNGPSTYHEVHFIKLLSEDSFNVSSCVEVVPTTHQLIAVLPFTLELSTSVLPSAPLFSHKTNVHDPAGDKCVLFCSFLI